MTFFHVYWSPNLHKLIIMKRCCQFLPDPDLIFTFCAFPTLLSALTLLFLLIHLPSLSLIRFFYGFCHLCFNYIFWLCQIRHDPYTWKNLIVVSDVFLTFLFSPSFRRLTLFFLRLFDATCSPVIALQNHVCTGSNTLFCFAQMLHHLYIWRRKIFAQFMYEH